MTIVVNLVFLMIVVVSLASMVVYARRIREIKANIREFQKGSAYRDRCFKKVETLHRELEDAMRSGDGEAYMRCVRRALKIMAAVEESMHSDRIPAGKDPDDM